MKKKILLALSFVLVVILSVGTTLALLTSEDSDHNTMTIGQAKIEQLEYQRVVDDNGNWVTSNYTGYGYTADLMEEFKQDELMLPTTGKPVWDDRNGSQAASGEGSHQQPWTQVGAPGSNQLFDDSFTNVKDKFVFVKNTGDVDVYYRTIIAIESPEGHEVISSNLNTNSRFEWSNTELDGMTQEEQEAVEHIYVTIDGTRYKLIVATYKEVLTKDEISRPSLLQVYMMKKATNEDVATYGDKVDVLVLSQAVQTSGFENAEAALNAGFGEVTIENAVEWFGSVTLELSELPQEAILTQNTIINLSSETTVDTVKNTGYNVVINGNDNKLNSGSASEYAVIANGGNTVINNLEVNSSGGGIGATNGAKVTFNGNSVYVDTASTSGRYVFYAEGEGTEITIEQGTFSWDPKDNQKRAYIYADEGTTIYVKGGTFGKASTRSGYTSGIMGNGKVIITGGTFGFNPSNWVANGYVATQNGSTWTVVAE